MAELAPRLQVLNSHLLPTDHAALATTPVIVLMVHNRPKYFEAVVTSLRDMKGNDGVPPLP
jgi:hypothetical protein